MLENLFTNLNYYLMAMMAYAKPALVALLVLWMIHLVNYSLSYRLNRLGLVPRKINGIPGIIFSPFLHGSFSHLFFNSIPFFVLQDFILMDRGIHSSLLIAIIIILISGTLLWLFGRRGVHVGASGVIMGYLAYLLVNTYQHPSMKTLLLGVVCLYYFGGLLIGLFPQKKYVSWEGHVFGFLGGMAAVFLVK
jgi:membrane associated rhomboid family serine protease